MLSNFKRNIEQKVSDKLRETADELIGQTGKQQEQKALSQPSATPAAKVIPLKRVKPETTQEKEYFSFLRNHAEMLMKSGVIKCKSVDALLPVLFQGNFMGISPVVAATNIKIENGKLVVSPELILSIVTTSGELEDFQIFDSKDKCTVVMKRSGRSGEYVASFSNKEAAALGCLNREEWRLQPALMRQRRAVMACARLAFPEVVSGAFSPDEIQDEINQTRGVIRSLLGSICKWSYRGIKGAGRLTIRFAKLVMSNCENPLADINPPQND